MNLGEQPSQGGQRVLTLKAPNGEELSAPAGVWLLALYDLMCDTDRTVIFERVKQMHDEAMQKTIWSPPRRTPGPLPIRDEKVTVDKDGKRHFTLFLESGSYFGKGKELGEKKEL